MLLDKIIAPLAPFYCLGCGAIGNVLCSICRHEVLERFPSRCYRCHKLTVQSQVCDSCRRASPVKHVWVATSYAGLAKEAVELMKFERAAAASEDIAHAIEDALPILSNETVICHIPTAPSRVRVRGYDQSRLVAEALAKYRGFAYRPLLIRVTSTRQLGAGREQRIEQANKAFELSSRYKIEKLPVLIIDDVTTSGATIEAAAKLLKNAGAKSINAAVFAQAVD